MTVLEIALLAVVVVGAVLALVVFRSSNTVFENVQREKEALAVEVERNKALAAQMIVPLTWIHQASQVNEFEHSRRIHQATLSTFVFVQAILQEDDLAMASRLDAAPEPPRRLPKYVQVPPYLASAEDVALRGSPIAQANEKAFREAEADGAALFEASQGTGDTS